MAKDKNLKSDLYQTMLPITVIIPAYNEEAAISSLLDELNEYVPFLDVVVINDGSVDNTAGFAAFLCYRHPGSLAPVASFLKR